MNISNIIIVNMLRFLKNVLQGVCTGLFIILGFALFVKWKLILWDASHIYGEKQYDCDNKSLVRSVGVSVGRKIFAKIVKVIIPTKNSIDMNPEVLKKIFSHGFFIKWY